MEPTSKEPSLLSQVLVSVGVTLAFALIAVLSYNDEGLGLSEFTGTEDINYFAALGAILLVRVFAFQWGQQTVRGHIDAVQGSQ